MRLVPRKADPAAERILRKAGTPALLSRLYAARGVCQATDLDVTLNRLMTPAGLKGSEQAAVLLADAIARKERLCIVADYDCDGATACAVGLRGLRMLGADVSFVVPNRFTTGYGLSAAVVDIVAQSPGGRPDWIITVDNGISSVEGVARASALGMRVIVTDHHLPGPSLPAAEAIVNPNQPGCGFESKNIAGVGVMFSVLLVLRAEMRRRGVFDASSQPRLDTLLDLVALGTIADVVRLDANNRILVAQGLARMRSGRMQPGVRALFHVAGRATFGATTFDLAFAVGPRINAAGRLDDMTVGIECLTTDDPERAAALAQQLDQTNRQRRAIEGTMKTQAQNLLAALPEGSGANGASICLFSREWHEGVVGIVAGRLKELHHRPTFVFAPNGDGTLRGSGRSIPGFHLRDALDLVAKRAPDVLLRFGGHAMAAGCTVTADGFARFAAAFDAVAKEGLSPELLARTLEVDGDLDGGEFRADTAMLLEAQVWGQGFAAPMFCSDIEVIEQRAMGQDGTHRRAKVRVRGPIVDEERELVAWGRSDPLPSQARIAWRLTGNTWQGITRPQMVLEAIEDD